MKHLPPRILQPADLVNRTVQDRWILAYLEALERWILEASAQGVVLAHLCEAWGEYLKYSTSSDPFFRRSAWNAIQTAAARLAHSRPIARKESVK
jgi:hypothetical protein